MSRPNNDNNKVMLRTNIRETTENYINRKLTALNSWSRKEVTLWGNFLC
jgi:hypothetical protein